MIEDTVTRQHMRCLYPIGRVQLFKGASHTFVDGVRRHIHDARDLLGIFMLINMPQRFDLRGREETDEIVGVTLHRRWNRASRVEIKHGKRVIRTLARI